MGALDKLRRREVMTPRGGRVPVTVTAKYRSAVDGLTQGAKTLTDINGDALLIPNGSTIQRVDKHVKTAFTSGGSATLALGITGSASAFLTATAYDNAANIGSDNHAAALPLRTTADVAILATIAGADLTAGDFDLEVTYLPPVG